MSTVAADVQQAAVSRPKRRREAPKRLDNDPNDVDLRRVRSEKTLTRLWPVAPLVSAAAPRTVLFFFFVTGDVDPLSFRVSGYGNGLERRREMGWALFFFFGLFSRKFSGRPAS